MLLRKFLALIYKLALISPNSFPQHTHKFPLYFLFRAEQGMLSTQVSGFGTASRKILVLSTDECHLKESSATDELCSFSKTVILNYIETYSIQYSEIMQLGLGSWEQKG